MPESERWTSVGHGPDPRYEAAILQPVEYEVSSNVAYAIATKRFRAS